MLSISTGSRIDRSGYSERLGEVALRMLEAVDGDLLAVDILETEDAVYALEINHNFDAHGGELRRRAHFCTRSAASSAPSPREGSSRAGLSTPSRGSLKSASGAR